MHLTVFLCPAVLGIRRGGSAVLPHPIMSRSTGNEKGSSFWRFLQLHPSTEGLMFGSPLGRNAETEMIMTQLCRTRAAVKTSERGVWENSNNNKKKKNYFSLCYMQHLKRYLNGTATASCSVSVYFQSWKDPSVTSWTMQRVKYVCHEHLKFAGSQILQPRPKSLDCSVSFTIVAQKVSISIS